jgi:hypothetical protein
MRARLIQCLMTLLFLGVNAHAFAVTEAILPAPVAKPNTSLTVSCPPLKLKSQNNNIILDASTTATTQIYFLKNHSSKSLWLDHPVKNASASAGWTSYLRPNEWSALLIDKKGFSLSCSVIQPGKVETLDCEQALTVCKPAHFTYTSTRKGSYWLVEAKSWKELLKALEKRGAK